MTLPKNFDKETLGEYAFGYTDGQELDENDVPVPVEIKGFKLRGGAGVNPTMIGLIVLGAAVFAGVAFLLVRVIRKNQVSGEERRQEKAESDAEELAEEDKVYVNILDQADRPEEDETDYEIVIEPEETPDDDEDDD